MRRALLAAVTCLALVLPAASQEMKRIGVILQGGPYYAYLDGLREGLGKLGVHEGRQVALVVRDAGGDLTAAEAAARSLERDGVDLIVAFAASVARAAKRGTAQVPIVFAVGTDPVGHGLVESVANPGGRVTGIHNIVTDLTAKRLELLHELVPGLRRVVTFYDPSNASARPAVDIARDAARQLAIELIERQVTSVEQIHDSLRALHRADADAFFFVSDAMVISQAVPIIERANALGIPTMATYTDLLGSGALVAYGVSFRDQGRRVAAYVVRILGGTRPGDLPVEGINVPSLAINRGAARTLGIDIPETILARADEVIE